MVEDEESKKREEAQLPQSVDAIPVKVINYLAFYFLHNSQIPSGMICGTRYLEVLGKLRMLL